MLAKKLLNVTEVFDGIVKVCGFLKFSKAL